MNLEMLIAFTVLAVTIFMFILDKIRMDIVALFALLTLFLTGVLDVDQTLAGFSDSTVIIIVGLFVVGTALFRTGVAAWISEQLLNLAGSSQTRLLILLMLGTAALSGFLSNTGTVAVLLPAAVTAAWRIGSTPSKLLMPLAIAANIGGLLTLIGTPPNLVLSRALTEAGERPFSFFEFAWVGLPLLIIGAGYVFIIRSRLLPERKSAAERAKLTTSLQELERDYDLIGHLFRVRARPESNIVGLNLAQAAIGHNFGLSVLHIDSGQGETTNHLDPPYLLEAVTEMLDLTQDEAVNRSLPQADTVVQANDILLLKGNGGAVRRLADVYDLEILPVSLTDASMFESQLSLVEILLTPRSVVVGRTLEESQLAQKYGVQVLGVLRSGKLLHAYRTEKLDFGDALLVNGTPAQIDLMRSEPRNFVVVAQPEEAPSDKLGPKAIIALVTMFIMLGLILFKIVPTVIAVLIAAMMMIVAGCIRMEQAYRAINWESVILIAAILPMSTALQETGGDTFIANGLINTVGDNPLLLLGGVFLLTAAFTQVISNTATSALLAPIAINAAQTVGISPHTAMIMVAVGASSAFVTPIASPVNMLVLNPGSYNFSDFVKVGLPLVLLFLLAALLLVPLVWPL